MIRTKKRKPMVRMPRTKKPMVRTKKPKAKPIPESVRESKPKIIRKKKSTFTRIKKPKNRPALPHGGHGGHMPDPPEDCQARKMIVQSENRIYIDSTSCIRCTKEKTCLRRREFDEEWAIYRGWVRDNKQYLKWEYEKRNESAANIRKA